MNPVALPPPPSLPNQFDRETALRWNTLHSTTTAKAYDRNTLQPPPQLPNQWNPQHGAQNWHAVNTAATSKAKARSSYEARIQKEQEDEARRQDVQRAIQQLKAKVEAEKGQKRGPPSGGREGIKHEFTATSQPLLPYFDIADDPYFIKV